MRGDGPEPAGEQGAAERPDHQDPHAAVEGQATLQGPHSIGFCIYLIFGIRS